MEQVLVELWGEGASFEEMRSEVAARPEDQAAPFIAPGTTFKVEISRSVLGLSILPSTCTDHVRTAPLRLRIKAPSFVAT